MMSAMSHRKRLYQILLALAFAAISTYLVGTSSTPTPASATPKDAGTAAFQVVATSSSEQEVAVTSTEATTTNATVVKVVDGDTLDAKMDADGKTWRIRFLGINTPETVDPRKPVECFGKEASARMHAYADGQRIRLVSDPLADEVDKYGRLLRNLYLADGTDLNAAMVRDGYAYAYLSFPLDPKRKKQLSDLQKDAKLHERGLWSPTTCNGQK